MHSDWCGQRGKIGGGILIWEGGGSCLNWDLWDLWDKQNCDLAASQFSVSLWGAGLEDGLFARVVVVQALGGVEDFDSGEEVGGALLWRAMPVSGKRCAPSASILEGI